MWTKCRLIDCPDLFKSNHNLLLTTSDTGSNSANGPFKYRALDLNVSYFECYSNDLTQIIYPLWSISDFRISAIMNKNTGRDWGPHLIWKMNCVLWRYNHEAGRRICFLNRVMWSDWHTSDTSADNDYNGGWEGWTSWLHNGPNRTMIKRTEIKCDHTSCKDTNPVT